MVILVRKESAEANISNSDDVRAFKYASCGINGVIKNRLNQIGYQTATGSFSVKSGEIIIDGWQVKVDAGGATITLDNSSGTRYYTVYCEIDLSSSENKTATITASYGTTTYPTITNGDDISLNDSGIARLKLYNFIATGQTISGVQQMFSLIDGTCQNAYNATNATNATNADKATEADYASSDHTKGTIEQRLTSLGFRQGTGTFTGALSYIDSSYSSIDLYRQGNYVIGKVKLFFQNQNAAYNFIQRRNLEIFTIPEEFRPKTSTYFTIGVGILVSSWLSMSSTQTHEVGFAVLCEAQTNGNVIISYQNIGPSNFLGANSYITNLSVPLSFGYEANPIST